MRAPVGHTCPKIDKIIGFIKKSIKDIEDFDNWEIREIKGYMDDIYDTLQQSIDYFEELREDNDSLRSWGYEVLKEKEGLENEIEDLQNKLMSYEKNNQRTAR